MCVSCFFNVCSCLFECSSSCCVWECCACARKDIKGLLRNCMMCDWPGACVFVCMLRHKEVPNILQLQTKLKVSRVQILFIESFLFVAWPGIPLQKLCVKWVHSWLCFVCRACHYHILCYHFSNWLWEFVEYNSTLRLSASFDTIIDCLKIFRYSVVYCWGFCGDVCSRHLRCMEKLRKELWFMTKQLEDHVAMVSLLINILNQPKLH